jgi:4-hydroxybenzoate polyprenyltransferase
VPGLETPGRERKAMEQILIVQDLGQSKAQRPEQRSSLPPLVVDLDGTLLKTDLLLESILALVKQHPVQALALPLWLLKGKARFKREIGRRVSLEVERLPYRQELLDYLRSQHARGRTLVLATATDAQPARQVAEHLQLFDSFMASDGVVNLSGEKKRQHLVSAFGEKGFDYVGNGRADLAVWRSARKAMAVNSSRGVLRALEAEADPGIYFQDPARGMSAYWKALRPQQWSKNLLVLVPVFAAHRFFEPALLAKALLAFLAFCCCASSGYLFNDLFDLAADRHHPRKRFRPFAAGELPLSYALTMVPALAIAGGILAALVSPLFFAMLAGYILLTLAYTLAIKKIVLLDVIVLAGLYTLRIVAGSASVLIWPSQWLLAFSIFLFLSLALVKRYGELVVMKQAEGEGARARSYELSDAELLAAKGTASGYLAVLVLALYLTSGTARALYGRLEVLWLLCPLLLYWIGRIWLMAHRGLIHDDPILFATTDRTSRVLVLLMLGTVLLAL